MTYDEFRRQIGKAGLTVKGFAALIKQTPNSITNYAAQGEVPPHLAIISALMGDMAEAGKISVQRCRAFNSMQESAAVLLRGDLGVANRPTFRSD
jgi:hypothetical protein